MRDNNGARELAACPSPKLPSKSPNMPAPAAAPPAVARDGLPPRSKCCSSAPCAVRNDDSHIQTSCCCMRFVRSRQSKQFVLITPVCHFRGGSDVESRYPKLCMYSDNCRESRSSSWSNSVSPLVTFAWKSKCFHFADLLCCNWTSKACFNAPSVSTFAAELDSKLTKRTSPYSCCNNSRCFSKAIWPRWEPRVTCTAAIADACSQKIGALPRSCAKLIQPSGADGNPFVRRSRTSCSVSTQLPTSPSSSKPRAL
mmetsp:Transcript_86087/g.248571  ORF Transcript_86087/g.248571 Transcript_86087/m.248571 type:complete len:255 (-) Transcript_86087:791-1555(-)